MRILTRFFVQSYLTYYAAIVAVSILVIAIVEMMVNFDHVIDYGEGISGVASYLFLRLPSYYLPFLLPVGSFGAAFLCLGLPARALEILAAKTSGIAPARIAAPVLATACRVLAARAVPERDGRAPAPRKRLDGGQTAASCSSRAARSGTSAGIRCSRSRAADRDTQTLQGVVIYERDANGPAPAQRARPTSRTSRPITAGASRTRASASSRATTRRPRRAPSARASAWFELGSAGDLALLGADPRGLTLLRLREYIRALDREGRDTARYRSLWHARLADPFSVLLFAVLGSAARLLGGARAQPRRGGDPGHRSARRLLRAPDDRQCDRLRPASPPPRSRRGSCSARSARSARGASRGSRAEARRARRPRAHSRPWPSRYWKNSVSGDSTSVVLPSIVLR